MSVNIVVASRRRKHGLEVHRPLQSSINLYEYCKEVGFFGAGLFSRVSFPHSPRTSPLRNRRDIIVLLNPAFVQNNLKNMSSQHDVFVQSKSNCGGAKIRQFRKYRLYHHLLTPPGHDPFRTQHTQGLVVFFMGLDRGWSLAKRRLTSPVLPQR